jgi:HNH endonuclease
MKVRPDRPNAGVCAVEGCGLPGETKGYCSMHYNRLRRHGQTSRGRIRQACKVEGCNTPASARGLCTACYHSAKYRGEFGKTVCSVDGCSTIARTKGLCGMHYARQQRGIPLDAPQRRVRGSGTPDRNGYIRVPLGGGRSAMEHRVVMEQMLGRPLLPQENVHHINGRRDDNRPSNLELWVKPQPNGQRVSDLVQWVVGNYRDEVLRLLA